MPTPSPARVHECTVVKNEPIAQDIFALRIASPELARMLEPGQFVDIKILLNHSLTQLITRLVIMMSMFI